MWLIPSRGINHISNNIIKSCTTLIPQGLEFVIIFGIVATSEKFWFYKFLWAFIFVTYCYEFFCFISLEIQLEIEKWLEWPNTYSVVLVFVMVIIGMVNIEFDIEQKKIIEEYKMMWLMWLIPCQGISHISHNIIRIIWKYLYDGFHHLQRRNLFIPLVGHVFLFSNRFWDGLIFPQSLHGRVGLEIAIVFGLSIEGFSMQMGKNLAKN